MPRWYNLKYNFYFLDPSLTLVCTPARIMNVALASNCSWQKCLKWYFVNNYCLYRRGFKDGYVEYYSVTAWTPGGDTTTWWLYSWLNSSNIEWKGKGIEEKMNYILSEIKDIVSCLRFPRPENELCFSVGWIRRVGFETILDVAWNSLKR